MCSGGGKKAPRRYQRGSRYRKGFLRRVPRGDLPFGWTPERQTAFTCGAGCRRDFWTHAIRPVMQMTGSKTALWKGIRRRKNQQDPEEQSHPLPHPAELCVGVLLIPTTSMSKNSSSPANG